MVKTGGVWQVFAERVRGKIRKFLLKMFMQYANLDGKW
jgi:hypothetical protein